MRRPARCSGGSCRPRPIVSCWRLFPPENGRDVFEIESRDGKIVVRGSSGVAIASGWNWYLTHYCHCHVSLWGNQLRSARSVARRCPRRFAASVPFKYRYYLNFCAFSYSLAWYDWPQWERLIDWMALHGINMPLSVTGQEAIWYKVYRDLGLSDEQIRKFLRRPRLSCRSAGWAASTAGAARCRKAGSTAIGNWKRRSSPGNASWA